VDALNWTRVVAAIVICLSCALSRAADVAGIYQTIVVPTGDKNRDSAFVEALRTVAIKATGSRDAASKISASIPNLRTYVQRFEQLRDDGSVLIEFDSTAVDKLLITLG
jgi:hypothetical protein